MLAWPVSIAARDRRKDQGFSTRVRMALFGKDEVGQHRIVVKLLLIIFASRPKLKMDDSEKLPPIFPRMKNFQRRNAHFTVKLLPL